MGTLHAVSAATARAAQPSAPPRRRPRGEVLELIVVRLLRAGLYALAGGIAVVGTLLGALALLVGVVTLPIVVGTMAIAAGAWVIGLAITACAAVISAADLLGTPRPTR
jgi:hypothetical protein